jgi:hypothetical protein
LDEPGDRPRYRGWLTALAAGLVLAGVVFLVIPGAPPQPPAPLTTAASTTTGPPVTTTPSPAGIGNGSAAQAVTDLLHRRSQAILRRDRAGFLATVDPKADKAFRTAQADMFTNLDTVPLGHWEYLLDSATAADVSGLRAGSVTPDEVWAPKIELRYALTDGDPVPTSRPMAYLLARRGTQWYVSSDTALESRGWRTWRGPWDFGRCVVARTPAGVVIGHQDTAAQVARIAAELDPAVQAVTAVWGQDWPRRAVVLLPSTPEELRALVGSQFAVDTIAAVAVADRVDERAHTAQGQRVVFNPGNAATLSDTGLRAVLRHELTHVAARGGTVDGTALWMLEGFADYVGYADTGVQLAQNAPDLVAAVRQSGPPAGLPPDTAFRADNGELSTAYQEAWSLALYVARHWDQATLVRLYRTVAAAGRQDDAQLDALLRPVLGVDRAGLITGWQTFLTENSG